MRAPFNGQVERKVAREGLFPFRLPKFESYQPGILNSPAAMLFTLAPPQCHARNRCRSCTLATPQLRRELSLLRRFGQIGRNSPAIRADFDPNGFPSSVAASAVGRPIEVHAYADRIVIRQDGRIVGEHARSFGRGETIYDPRHYTDRVYGPAYRPGIWPCSRSKAPHQGLGEPRRGGAVVL
jgi:hypothetical protein